MNSEQRIPRFKWSAGGMLKDDKGGYVFRVDYSNLKIALKLAQAQNRELRKQLATATEALERIVDEWPHHADSPENVRNTAKQALAAIKPNQGEQP